MWAAVFLTWVACRGEVYFNLYEFGICLFVYVVLLLSLKDFIFICYYLLFS